MRFKTDWASLIIGSKFTVFAVFYFVFESNFSSTSPRGAYILFPLRGDLTEDFLRYRFVSTDFCTQGNVSSELASFGSFFFRGSAVSLLST